MNYDHEKQRQYFQKAYQTSSDIWSHLRYKDHARAVTPPAQKDSLALDIGIGRGSWMMSLIEMGYRTIGIDYVDLVVKNCNQHIQKRGLQSQGRCLQADALCLPFMNGKFSLITDIGTMQHIPKTDWNTYKNEVTRLCKKDGYYLNISMSRNTTNFLGISPQSANIGSFMKFDTLYNFTTLNEIEKIFSEDFEIAQSHEREYQSYSDPEDSVTLLFTLFKKRKTR